MNILKDFINNIVFLYKFGYNYIYKAEVYDIFSNKEHKLKRLWFKDTN